MRSAALRHRRTHADDEDLDRWMQRSRLMRLLLRRPRDSFAMVVAAGAVTAIVVNGLFLQHGPHPAPIFAIKPLPVAARESTNAINVLPRPRPADSDTMRRERPRTEIMSDIQRELARRGYYDGAVDGVHGAKTDAAIRDFEQTAGLKPSSEPGEPLLAAIMRAHAKPKALPSNVAPRRDPIGELIAQRPLPASAPPQAAPPQPSPKAASPQPALPQQASLQSSPQILAVQRALSEFGYGQIKPTGVYDADTRLAIQHFERDRRLPITGEISDRVRRELAALTGRPLD